MPGERRRLQQRPGPPEDAGRPQVSSTLLVISNRCSGVLSRPSVQIGECVVVHLGFGEWIVTDSCIGRSSREPIAIAYLNRLGVDLGAVRLIVVTHWHDDHMQGAAEIMRQALGARFVCSAALRGLEFAALLAFGSESMMSSSGIDEFRNILDIIREHRASRGAGSERGAGSLGDGWAGASRTQ